jgi:hypothetical protein
MRRLIVIISLLFSIGGSHAQTVTWQNTYRENDLLKWKQITFPDISVTGTSVIWDISQCRETSDEDYIVELFNFRRRAIHTNCRHRTGIPVMYIVSIVTPCLLRDLRTTQHS